jgi:hypothetical protein
VCSEGVVCSAHVVGKALLRGCGVQCACGWQGFAGGCCGARCRLPSWRVLASPLFSCAVYIPRTHSRGQTHVSLSPSAPNTLHVCCNRAARALQASKGPAADGDEPTSPVSASQRTRDVHGAVRLYSNTAVPLSHNSRHPHDQHHKISMPTPPTLALMQHLHTRHYCMCSTLSSLHVQHSSYCTCAEGCGRAALTVLRSLPCALARCIKSSPLL